MLGEISEEEFAVFVHFLKKTVGVSPPGRKRRSFGRRLKDRAEALGFENYITFYRFLRTKEGAAELSALIDFITIDQSSFFRGDQQMTLLARKVFPELCSAGPKRLRIWSAGCARGQEPYTLSMLLADLSATRSVDYKILATDIDRASLTAASRAVYGPEAVKGVPARFLKLYFTREKSPKGGVYRVREEVKGRVMFRLLNLMETPYRLHGPIDMILCRNVMIYFDAADKKRIIEEFHRLLPAGGALCLGGAESLIGIDDRFTLLSHAVYRKNG
ncbi:MAG: protein-glutamate O-methyltransferase CheR [Thermodesulfobacteriota bacterium]